MELLQQAYNRDAYLHFLAEKFIFSRSLADIAIDSNEVETFKQLGFVSTHDGKQLPVFEIYIKPDTQLSRNRVQLRNLVAKQITIEDGALAVYVDEPNKQWRFSFIAIEYVWNDDGLTKTQTASKRFTYLFGENTQTRTAQKRFFAINQQSTLEDLKKAFAVEALNKEFYDKLYTWYEKAQDQVTFPNDEKAENHTQTSLIRLLTRLLFIWFLKEKKLINADLFDGDKLQTLIKYEKPSSFYKAILQNLFFATLNRSVTDRSFRTTTNGTANETNYLATNIYRYQDYFTNEDENDIMALFEQTPFLNGGLFECLDREASDEEKQSYDNDPTIRPVRSAIRMEGFSDRPDNQLKLDNALFFNNDEQDLGLISLFSQYQFTIEESTPLDIEVALDPELLGKVFENLLASYNPETGQQARKATGSFYTPREIVSYMVDESLTAYLLEKAPPHDGDSEFYKERLQDLMSVSDKTDDLSAQDDALIYPEEIPELIKAISSIKIIDPAVGSGAFPMGILQRLVALLRLLDPDNKGWKKQKLAELPDLRSIEADLKISEKISDDKARQKAQKILNDKSQDIITNFEKQDHNYLRKLYLIEDCIYGVDIQPIAIQICKLRFFISLTIEQTPNPDKNDNYGIKALPNLETRFIVANSLLPLGEMPKQVGIFDRGIKELQQQLAEVRHKYFSAKTLKTKRKYREKDKALRQQMLDALTENGITPDVEASMRKIVNWDLYNQNSVADWFDPEWQFGIQDGFNIVIGNPPYISHEKISKKDKLLIKKNYLSYEPFADLYCYFFEKSVNLQQEKGVLSLITSNSFLRAEYGKPTRDFLSKSNALLKILNIHKSQVFDKAVVNVSIIISCKTKDDVTCDIVNSEINNKFSEITNDTFSYEQFYFDESPWTLINPELIKLRNKIKSIGKSLEELKVKIRLGIATGNNEAFIIDENKKRELCKENPNNNNIIKPLLRGRDVYKYFYNASGLYILLTKNDVNVQKDYPEIYNHFLSFGKKFRDRGAKGKHWTNLRACSFYDDFKKDKIIWIELTDSGRFALSGEEVYLLNSAYYLIPPDKINSKFLLAILNSKIIYFYLELIAETSGMGTNRWINNYVKQFPIPQIPPSEQRPFIGLVNKIIKAKQNNTDTTALETEIDQMVYKLYNLTADEIKIIEDVK